MFKITIDEVKKIFDVKAEGFLSMKEAMEFVNDFIKKAKMVPTSNYTLIIDTRELQAGTPEVAENMKNVMRMYIDTPFKNRYAYKLERGIAQMQVERIGRTQKGFEKIKFINNKFEIKL